MSSEMIFKTTKHSRPNTASSRNSSRIVSTNTSLIIPTLPSTSRSNKSNKSDVENISPGSSRPPTVRLEQNFKIDLSTKNLNKLEDEQNKRREQERLQAEHQIKSIDKLLSQRDQMNENIMKKRKEKQRLARLKAIDDLKKAKEQEKLEIAKRDREIAEQLAEKLKLTKSKSKMVNANNKHKKSCPTPSTATSITNVSSRPETSRSVLSHGKSETLDAILDSLRDIEESTKSQIEEFQSSRRTMLEESASLNTAKASDEVQFRNKTNESQVTSKINSIMSYLEDIENSTTVITPRTYTSQSQDQSSNNPDQQNAETTVQEITNSVLSQKLQLDEAKQAIKILEKSLNKQKELSVHQMKQTEADLSSRIKVQKEHYESTITRHLSFIDQLITDKKKLQEKYEDLSKKSKDNNQSLATALDKQRKQHQEAINMLKENYLKAEKDRREKWKEEQTKIIKKSTVNALEPEINKLMSAHKQEINRLKTLHEADIIEADERASKKYVEQISKLRKDLESERDEAVDRERINAQARFDKMLEQEEIAFHAQKKRLYQEIAEEKERLFHQSNRLKKENEEFKKQLETTQSSAVKALTAEFETAKCLSEKRHKKEMEDLKTDQKHEQERQKNAFEKEFEIKVASMQKVIMEGSREARDKEIKLIIERLENEHNESRSVDSQAVENRIRRVREKYESELREVERSERLTQNRYVEVKQKLVDESEKSLAIDRKFKQLSGEFEEVKSKMARLVSEKDQVRDIIRDEFSDRLVLLEDENSRYKREFSEMRARLGLGYLEKSIIFSLTKHTCRSFL